MTYKIYYGVILSILGAILWSVLYAHTGAWWVIGMVCFDIGWMCLYSGLEELDAEIYDIKERIREFEKK